VRFENRRLNGDVTQAGLRLADVVESYDEVLLRESILPRMISERSEGETPGLH